MESIAVTIAIDVVMYCGNDWGGPPSGVHSKFWSTFTDGNICGGQP